MNHIPATTNSQNYEEIRKLVLQLQKNLKMYTDNVAAIVANLQESVERAANHYRRMEIVLTEVEDALKEEEQEQPQKDEVQELEAVLATEARLDVCPKEIVEVSKEKAPHIGEFQLVTATEENAIIKVKKEIRAPDAVEEFESISATKRPSKVHSKKDEPKDQLEQNEHFVHEHLKLGRCLFASVSATPKLMLFFRVSKHRWRWKISLVDSGLEMRGKAWASGVQEVLADSPVFVCSHGSRNWRCGVCVPVLIGKQDENVLQEMCPLIIEGRKGSSAVGYVFGAAETLIEANKIDALLKICSTPQDIVYEWKKKYTKGRHFNPLKSSGSLRPLLLSRGSHQRRKREVGVGKSSREKQGPTDARARQEAYARRATKEASRQEKGEELSSNTKDIPTVHVLRLRRISKEAHFIFRAMGHVWLLSSWPDLGSMGVLSPLFMSKAYLSFLRSDLEGYSKGKELRFLFVWVALLPQKFNLFVLVIYCQLQLGIVVIPTLWERSFEEWVVIILCNGQKFNLDGNSAILEKLVRDGELHKRDAKKDSAPNCVSNSTAPKLEKAQSGAQEEALSMERPAPILKKWFSTEVKNSPEEITEWFLKEQMKKASTLGDISHPSHCLFFLIFSLFRRGYAEGSNTNIAITAAAGMAGALGGVQAVYTEAWEEECRELTTVAKECKIKKEREKDHGISVGGLDVPTVQVLSSWSGPSHKGLLVTLDISKAYLCFIRGDFGRYPKSLILQASFMGINSWGKEYLQKKGPLKPLNSFTGAPLNVIEDETPPRATILKKEFRHVILAWIAFLPQKFSFLMLVLYVLLQMDVLTTSGGDYLGRLMFANSGLQKYSFANLKFQTLWARSSEEGKYVMSLPREVRKEATRSWKEGRGKEASASVKEGTNSMIMGEVSELHMLELVGKAMVVGHVLYVSSGEVMGSLVVIM